MKFTFKDFFSKCDQICGRLQIWSHLLKKSLVENFIFCAVKLKFSVKYFIRKCKQTRECIKSYFTLSVFYQLKIRVAVIQEPLNLFGMQHCVKSVRIQSFSGPYFLAFGLHTERYGVSLRMQSKCEKIRTKKTPNTVTFHAMQIN